MANQIKDDMSKILMRDKHCPEHGYDIKSLYFDTIYDDDLYFNQNFVIESFKETSKSRILFKIKRRRYHACNSRRNRSIKVC